MSAYQHHRLEHTSGPQPPRDPSYRDPYHSSSDSMQIKQSLYEALEVIRRGKWVILGVALIVFATAAGLTFTMTPEYTVSTVVFVDTQTPQVANDALTAGAAPNSALGMRNLENQTLLLQQSVHIAEQTAKRLRELKTLPESNRQLPILKAWQEQSNKKNLSELIQEKYIRVAKVSNQGNAISIQAMGPHPVETALLANTYAEEYVQRTQQWNRQHVSAARDFLEKQIAQRKQELDSMETQLTQYMEQANASDLEAQAKNVVAYIADLEAQVDEARTEKEMNEAKLRSIQNELSQIEPKLAQRLASNVEEELNSKQEQLAKLNLKIDNVYQQNPELRNNASENPELANQIQQWEQQVASLNQEIEDLSQRYVEEASSIGGANTTSEGNGLAYAAQLRRQAADARVAISGAEARLRTLSSRLQEYEQQRQSLPEQSIRLAALRRDHKATENLYKRLVDRLQEIRISEESTTAFAEIVRPAYVPDKPNKPNIPKNLASGALLGLMIGVVAAFARQKLDSRVHTPDHLREPGYNILGVIPDMKTVELAANNGTSEAKDEALVVHNGDAPMASHLNPSSPIAEAYRRLALSLQFSQPGEDVQTVLITSPEAGAGKSTTALNLAVTAARSGNRTLIIDGDLRRPTLYRHIDQPNTPTLEDLLHEPNVNLSPSRFSTKIENLYAITTPTPIPGAVDLLSSKGMISLLEQLKTVYDVIIFDSPPILLATDGAYLSKHCDATVVVASAESTDKSALLQTIEELKSIGTEITGLVLNRFDATNTFGYNTTYKYRYGYYSSYYSNE